MMLTRKQRIWIVGISAFLALVAVILVVGWYKLYREVPVEYSNEDDNFKYGTIGTEDKAGIPFYIWKALPRVCPDLVPGPDGYASFGMIYEPGHDAPIGFTVKTIGFPRIAINCAFCHTGTVRDSADAAPRTVLAGGAHQLDAQAYLQFLFRCAGDPHFTADRIIDEIQRDGAPLSALDRLLYRYLLIPQTRKGILQQRDDYAWMESRTRWGRGRIEPFNPVKFVMLKLPIDDTIGVADFLPLWTLTSEVGGSYHWDGLNTDLGEVVRSSALGDGATTRSIALANLERIQRWIGTQKPPPYPRKIDQALADRGKQVFATAGCARCHDRGGSRFRTVIPVDELATDRHRVDMWTERAKDTYMKYADGKSWAFKHFQKQNGYVAVPLDGLWLRAPYLHNGSVPTLYQLLTPRERVARFYRGSDVLEPDQVGFAYQPPDDKAKAAAFLKHTTELDTSVAGNGNQGHTYGADLDPENKTALIEYLKTL